MFTEVRYLAFYEAYTFSFAGQTKVTLEITNCFQFAWFNRHILI